MKRFKVAIDGYSSCGKSTLAKALARKLHWLYIDSGAMYRAITLYFINHGVDYTQEAEVAQMLPGVSIRFELNEDATRIFLNNEEVTQNIRSNAVNNVVSEFAAIKAVRDYLVKLQRRLAADHDVIMDGRDIGTKVFPDADLKLFMTADPKVRAQRRYDEMRAKGDTHTSLEAVFENLAHRDYTDTTRQESPLTRAADAIVIDNTGLTEEQQLGLATAYINDKKATQN